MDKSKIVLYAHGNIVKQSNGMNYDRQPMAVISISRNVSYEQLLDKISNRLKINRTIYQVELLQRVAIGDGNLYYDVVSVEDDEAVQELVNMQGLIALYVEISEKDLSVVDTSDFGQNILYGCDVECQNVQYQGVPKTQEVSSSQSQPYNFEQVASVSEKDDFQNPQYYFDSGRRIVDNGVSCCGDKQLHESNDHEKNENPSVDLIQEINDRLFISRMVSDSLVKAVVGAIEQKTFEKIAQIELELVEIKEMLRTCNACNNNEILGSAASHNAITNVGCISRDTHAKSDIAQVGLSNNHYGIVLNSEHTAEISGSAASHDTVTNVACISQDAYAKSNIAQVDLSNNHDKIVLNSKHAAEISGSAASHDAVTNGACIPRDIYSKSDIAQVDLGNNHDGIVLNSEPTAKCEIKDMEIEYVLLQEVTAILYAETLKEKVSDLNDKYVNEVKLLEEAFMEKENSLKLEKIKLAKGIEQKENLAQKMRNQLVREIEKLKIAAQEREKLRGEQAEAAKRTLSLALQNNQLELRRLDGELNSTVEELMKTSVEKTVLLNVVQEHMKQLEIVNEALQSLLKAVDDLEKRVTNGAKNHDSRLDALGSQVSVLREAGSIYKQRLERKCSDLQRAETEVNLLGDEVDALIGLLEKIYIALDHYSPVLLHYTGITETLKLVKKELSGKLVGSSLEKEGDCKN